MANDSTLDARPAHALRRALPMLTVVFSGEARIASPFTRELPVGDTVVGRGDLGSDGITLSNDPVLSRKHACFSVDARREKVKVSDLGSHNGVFVNGRRREDTWLVNGDCVRIGESLLIVRFGLPGLPDPAVEGLLGHAPATRTLRRSIKPLGQTNATVLLLGESGTGKEVVARALHRASGRSGPFIAVNCSAMAEGLVESQLFGHRAGAFTGAAGAQKGFFRAATGGTLFLDEVGDLPLSQQPKLLRALEQRAVVPVGETTPVPFDARIIAATNIDLTRAVEAERFRGDLMARLDQVRLELPPLRQRREDILVLLDHAFGGPMPPLEVSLAEALLLHPWAGNVRELFAVATELRVRGQGEPTLWLNLVADRLSPPPTAPAPDVAESGPQAIPDRAELEALLSTHNGNLSQVAKATGRSRMQVYRWLQRHQLDAGRFRDEDDGTG